jgi:hypothetical protein
MLAGADVAPTELAAMDVAVTDVTGTLDGATERLGGSFAMRNDVLLALGCARLVGAAEVGAAGSWIAEASPRAGALDGPLQPARQATSDAATPLTST